MFHRPMETIGNGVQNESIANVTIDREAYPKRWYVAHVQMKCEKKSALWLQKLGYEVFVPTQQEVHQWSDRKKKIERILIPLVVFVKSDSESIKMVERQPYVYRMLCAPGEKNPAIVPDDQIERLKFMLGNYDSQIMIEPLNIKKGDMVMIVRGKLLGLKGFISDVSDAHSKVSIVIDYIGCASIIIDRHDLEVV